MKANEYEEFCKERFTEARKYLIGTFDTGLACNCGNNVADHACDPPMDFSNMPMGAFPSARDLLQKFQVHHEYWCDSCGAMYKTQVIEGARGYVPRERTPDGMKLLEVPKYDPLGKWHLDPRTRYSLP